MAYRSLVWFRGKELRLSDHRPLHDAARRGEVIPLFVLDPYFFAPERAKRLAHRMQFLLESLVALARNLGGLGSRLVVVAGRSVEVVPRLAELWRVDRVVSQRWSEPFGRERDRRIQSALKVPFELCDGETLLPPETLRTGSRVPYTIFTPFARAFAERAGEIGAPLPSPRRLPPVPADVAPRDEDRIPCLDALGIATNPRLVPGGERAARARLRAFVRYGLAGYEGARDRVAAEGTSRLGPDLKFGTISPRAVWAAARESAAGAGGSSSAFCRQLVWREFAHATLWDRPDVLTAPFRPAFAGFPWRNDPGDWSAWVRGVTGYPMVDAAARQLLAEGMVHNRARMIAASFLAKQLLVDFRRGEQHYLEHLVDGDLANNDLGWQWSAGCGCDAQPYFRVFNPTLQGKRFDPRGEYVRRWLPEIARLSDEDVHTPWLAPSDRLRAAGVVLGRTYPRPCVDLGTARARYLAVAEQHLRHGPSAGARARAAS